MKKFSIFIMVLFLATSICCTERLPRNHGQLKFISRRINGKIIALLDRNMTPVILQERKLIVCKDGLCIKPMIEFDLPGVFQKYSYDDVIDSQYTDIVSIISNDGKYTYLSAFGCNHAREYEYNSQSHINKNNYVKIFESKINTGRFIDVNYSNKNNQLIWMVQSPDLKKVYVIDHKGEIISEMDYDSTIIIKPFYDKKEQKLAFYGLSAMELSIFELDKNMKLSEKYRFPSGLNIDNDKLMINDIAPIIGYSNDYMEKYICVTDGTIVLCFDTLTRSIVIKESFNNIRIGSGGTFLFTDDGVFKFGYDNKEKCLKINKISDSDYRLLWYHRFEFNNTMYFIKEYSNSLDLLIIDYAVWSYDFYFNSSRHIIIDKSDDIKTDKIEYVITVVKQGGFDITYVCTQDSIYLLDEVYDN